MNKIAHFILFTAFVLLILVSCSSTREQSFVQDQAELLSAAQKQRLSELQRLLLKEHDVHLFVATLDHPAANLDQLALELFEKKSLGQQTNGARGLLLVVDPQQRQVRIEVGYDLEGVFPDGFIAGLEYDQMLPFFQQDRIGHGIEALTELLVERLMHESRSESKSSQAANHLSGGAGAKIKITEKPPAVTHHSRTDSETFLPQITPMATLESYCDSLSARNKNPNLGIFTPESREFFSNWLVTDAQQQNALKILNKNLPAAEVVKRGNVAVIRFPLRSRQASPYFLRNSATGWQLDFATMSQTIGFNHRNQWHFHVQEHPYSFAFEDWLIDTNGFPYQEK